MTNPESANWLSQKFLSLALMGAEWVLWILIFLSLAAVTVVIERAIFYSGISGTDSRLIKTVNTALAEQDLDAVHKLVAEKHSPGARMIVGMLEAAGAGTASVSARMAGSRTSEKIRMDRFLSFLGTIGANAPFIGLFGTVLEILRVFNQLGAGGVTSGQEAAGIMTGISEALVATAVGLLVAIPAVIAYNAYQRKVKRLMSEADALTGMVLAQLADESHRPSARQHKSETK